MIEHLQTYWWLLLSVLGALLVFLLFVQGGQTMLFCRRKHPEATSLMTKSLGHKWELTFTMLVVFGGAFFASFPLYYSTSFGGAYWLWMLILVSFVLQAVSYEFRSKPGNFLGTRVYDGFLFFNGAVGCILLGVAVAMFFTPNDFTVTKTNLVGRGCVVISQWGAEHGFEAIFNLFNLLLGFTVLFLARTMAGLYFINNISDGPEFYQRERRGVMINGVIFVVLFLAFMGWLICRDGYGVDASGKFIVVPFKYLMNYVEMWWCLVMLLVGVVMVLWGIGRTILSKREYRCGIWWAGIGVILVVLTLFWVAGYNDTAYLPSADITSSLTIHNSSSSLFTLEVMSWVSVIVPFVAAYIVYAWWAMDRKNTAD